MHTDIHTYYNHVRADMLRLWAGRRNRALHFGIYDENARDHAAALENTNRVMADAAGILPGQRVLDAGCGIGGSCFWLTENRGTETVGITPLASQIADCQKFAAERGLAGRTKFVQADYLEMPFADGSFDVVWALESVCHTDRKAAFFREAARVLRPGGRLVLLDLMRRERPFSVENEAFMRSFLHDWAIPDLDTPGEHTAHAEAAGFSKIVLTDFTENVRVSFRNVHDMSRRWLWAGRFLHKIGLLSGVRLRNAEASVRQYEALQAGLWGYFLAVCSLR